VRSAIACSLLVLLAGCATQLTAYKPTGNEPVMYNQGVGAVSWQTTEAVLTMYPTFRYQSPSDIPTFTLMVENRTSHNIDFVPETIHAWLDSRECHVYTLEERVSEIRSAKKRKQIALAVIGGLAAGAAAYGASHSTTTYNSYGTATSYNSYGGIRQTNFISSSTIQTYDPAAGILAGAAVGAATGVGIHQIEKAAGYEEQAAQGIFQHTTIQPGATIVGQVMLKPTSSEFGTLRLDVPLDSNPVTFMFLKTTTSD
jgi:hypothetical protein